MQTQTHVQTTATAGHTPPQFLRIEDVMDRTGFARSQVYRMIRRGEFPKQIRISHKLAVWSERAISDWILETLGEADGSTTALRRCADLDDLL